MEDKKKNCRAYRNPLHSVPNSIFILDCFHAFSSTPKTKHPVAAGSVGSSARSNLRTVSVEHNSDVCEISLMKLPPTHIAKISLLIAVLGS